MIRYDSTSIYNRIVERLNQDPDWKPIMNDSVISALVKSNAEANAETARYAEYLFKESRWDTAQNNSSILSMANMLGYRPKRRVSARGKLYVSLDPRTHGVGTVYPYDDFLALSKGTAPSSMSTWIKNSYSALDINTTASVTDSKGNRYIVTGSSQLPANGYIASVDIMQGVKKSKIVPLETIRKTATVSRLNPYLYIPLKIDNVEDASNLASIGFLKVKVLTSSGTKDSDIAYREYRIVDSLLLSSPQDYDCELYNDLYSQRLFYLKFRNDLYSGTALDLSSNSSIIGIQIDYVESAGASGNIDSLFENFTVSDLKSTDGQSVRLYGVNYTAVNGGSDEESIDSIKRNAVKSYTKYFSIGTKEAYEKAILNTSFKLDSPSIEIRPKKAVVYGGKDKDVPVTKVSFIGSGLEDLSSVPTSDENPYKTINEALNRYLIRLKSPQDILQFEPPVYTAFSVGLECKVKSGSNGELTSIQSGVRDWLDANWGPNSDTIDFGKNLMVSDIMYGIRNLYSDIESVTIKGVEAVTKLNWGGASRMTPTSTDTSSDGIIHTCRIPFDFSNAFLGTKNNKGFEDHRTGSPYVMRIDILYKKPSVFVNTASLHKTILIKDTTTDPKSTGFWHRMATDTVVWPAGLETTKDYTALAGGNQLDQSYQIDFEPGVLDNNDFLTLVSRIDSGMTPTRTNTTSTGALGNYLVYFSGDYSGDTDRMGGGWIEFTFDDIYGVLSAFSLVDSQLKLDLTDCPLYALKCGVADGGVFEKFKNIVYKYVDIYVSMRPISTDLDASGHSNEVLYIDSYDTKTIDNGYNIENLTSIKKARFIDVHCTYSTT